MMMSLFSVFDPSLSLMSVSWLVMVFLLIGIPHFVFSLGVVLVFFTWVLGFLSGEVVSGVSLVFKGMLGFLSSLFLCLFFLNFFSMFPFFFSCTSHFLVTFPLAFVFWLSVIVFFWFNFFGSFLVHLIPSGTPLGLMSFMVLVEVLSNFIRPLALMFRLTANIMAGHLLMGLIGGVVLMLGYFVFLGMFFQGFLVLMELGVSFIQSYVFFMLILLYISESY